jgi:hypothetical protein
MVTGVLFLMLVLLALLLAAFIYQIVTTPLPAVDAPTLLKSAAAPPASAPAPASALALPGGQHRAPAATGPAPRTPPPGAPGSEHQWATAALAIVGVAAFAIGVWLFLNIAPGGAACSPNAMEICSQGFVLLTGTQLAGGAITVAGAGALVIAVVRASR